jgi:hypothetical protein
MCTASAASRPRCGAAPCRACCLWVCLFAWLLRRLCLLLKCVGPCGGRCCCCFSPQLLHGASPKQLAHTSTLSWCVARHKHAHTGPQFHAKPSAGPLLLQVGQDPLNEEQVENLRKELRSPVVKAEVRRYALEAGEPGRPRDKMDHVAQILKLDGAASVPVSSGGRGSGCVWNHWQPTRASCRRTRGLSDQRAPGACAGLAQRLCVV